MYGRRRFEEGGEQLAPRLQYLSDLGQTPGYVVHIQVGEDRDGDGVVESNPEAAHLELILDEQVGPLIRKPFLRKFLPSPLDQGRIDVEPVIVAPVEVVYETNATPERSAPDVYQAV